MDRRLFLLAGSCLMTTAAVAEISPANVLRQDALRAEMVEAEKASGGRLGISVLDTASGATFSYRGGERFAMCSTFKLLLVTAVLCRVDRGQESLERRLPVRKQDILGNSDFTASRVGGDAAIAELCQSTVTISDNAAANLLLDTIGGPAGLTRFFRTIGDSVTRLDRNEPSMGDAAPGDPRDTSTPFAMAATLRRILLGDVLAPASLKILFGWLKGVVTGPARLRAGLPLAWELAHKTGTGMHGTTNDVGIVWPPGRAPLIVVTYLTGSPLKERQREAILARVGKAIGAAY
jgi:beta-lactamase class A